MDTQRLILFFIFSFSLLLLWDAWQKDQRPKPAPAAQAQSAPGVPTPAKPLAPPPSSATAPTPAAGDARCRGHARCARRRCSGSRCRRCGRARG